MGDSALQSGKTITSLLGSTPIPSGLGTTVTGALANLHNTQIDLLWTNSTSSMGSETVPLNTNGKTYILYIVQFDIQAGWTTSTPGNYDKVQCCIPGHDCTLQGWHMWSGGAGKITLVQRGLSSTSTTMTFGNGLYITDDSTSPTTNATGACVPVYIYGLI